MGYHDHIHPESIRQLRDLISLHGTIRLKRVIDEIEDALVAEWETEAHKRMSESVAASTEDDAA